MMVEIQCFFSTYYTAEMDFTAEVEEEKQKDLIVWIVFMMSS